MQSFHFKAFLRILVILALGLLAMYLIKHELTYSFLLVCLLVVALFFELYFFQKAHYSAIDRIVLAMMYDDYSLKTTKVQANETMNNLQRLYQKLQTQQQQNEIRELVYLNILNNIETGILILEKKGTTWEIFFINDYFSGLFDIPKIKSWTNLERLLPSLTHHLEVLNFKESKESIDIKIEEEEKQTFILQTSNTISQNQEYFIVLLDSIQKVLDKKEKDTWENLMKIISHEIMNSLTPIHSLAHNTQQILEEEEHLSEEDIDDIKLSINTIVNRTDHLQQFIDNYRKLTMLASPKKQVVAPERILQLSVETLMPLFKQNKITVHTDFSLQTTVEWDAKQMEQVFINLLTNAIHATAKQEVREININLYEKNNRICIDVEDSGAGILPEIKEKIFIPFYTTREEGAGIGLPLSKNIVEMHNGYLTYQRREDKTVFSLNFPMY
ncbi:sensor histidine kinase [Myroides marinus]|uniref:sensor histidine kinase n=1 Tax=Myroides marinus TaxID=703342 RepID=UPI0025788ADE|nr:HAMP domain-containing sensor histidine kinase [Myroides marinus]MDM1379543.1 HAMP domain-containing histidine kinase [Myroides marinus]MDM1386814.1 HAMP domain-containing histidine kinase [Myroides marinus]MDM1394027.1 HAMP domain-containing histidine kinase [Myroides marinus]